MLNKKLIEKLNGLSIKDIQVEEREIFGELKYIDIRIYLHTPRDKNCHKKIHKNNKYR